MARKVITKADALRIGWNIAPIVVMQAEKFRLDAAQHERERSGNWCVSSFEIEGPDFILSDSMRRHTDGRIRDRFNFAHNLLGFARWFLQHFPDSHEAGELRENLSNPALVSATIEDVNQRTAFKRLTKGRSTIPLEECEEILMSITARA